MTAPSLAIVVRGRAWRRLLGSALLLVLMVGCSGHKKMDCATLDVDLVSCPAPKPPRIKALTGGHVVVQLRVRADGVVADARVVSASGHPAWKDAVLHAVRQWRFRPEKQGFIKTMPFDFRLGEPASARSSSAPAH